MANKKLRRELTNCKSVEISDRNPTFPRRGRRTQVQNAGLFYERKVAEYLSALFGEENVIHGPWLLYTDENGTGWCQPDIFFFPPHLENTLWVGECKLKAVKAAQERLDHMYLPLAKELYPDHTIIGVQFCRHLSTIKRSNKGQRNLIDCGDLISMKEYDKHFYTVNLRRVY